MLPISGLDQSKVTPSMVNPCLSNYWANVILIIKNSSLRPPIGGVQAWHDDKVMNPVADVEQGKH